MHDLPLQKHCWHNVQEAILLAENVITKANCIFAGNSEKWQTRAIQFSVNKISYESLKSEQEALFRELLSSICHSPMLP